ncbi:MAG: hypothetical protein EBZ76_12895 [Synechococcaceae bacterium WB9_2_170]|nr:hypothetical protein [Synechococcaceae bacterium WB9_2_170]
MAISCIRGASAIQSANLGSRHRCSMVPENPKRPPWLNWVFLLIFLWSSYQLAGFWFERLHAG